MADLLTLDEVRASLNLGDDLSHDDELDLYIDAVTAHVEDRYGTLPASTLTEIAHASFRDDGVVRLLPARTPSAVTSLTHYDGRILSSGFTVTADGYVEHLDLTPGRWTIVYTGGFAAVPADLKLAALEDIRGLFQPGQIGPPASFGAFGLESTDTGTSYQPVRMWPRVDAWIENHTLPGIA